MNLVRTSGNSSTTTHNARAVSRGTYTSSKPLVAMWRHPALTSQTRTSALYSVVPGDGTIAVDQLLTAWRIDTVVSTARTHARTRCFKIVILYVVSNIHEVLRPTHMLDIRVSSLSKMVTWAYRQPASPSHSHSLTSFSLPLISSLHVLLS